jgi:hypothetical protein
MLKRRLVAAGLWLALSLLPSFLAGEMLWANWFSRLAAIGAVALLAFAVETHRRGKALFVILLAGLLGSVTVYVLFEVWQSAWLVVILWFAILLVASRQLLLIRFARWYFRWLWSLTIWAVAALNAGMGLAILNAFLSRFAEEEFFIAISGIFVAFFWLILAQGYNLAAATPEPALQKFGRPQLLVPSLVGVAIFIGLLVVPQLLAGYQRSFFPLEAPTYPGITEETPFICGQTVNVAQRLPAAEIKEDFISLLQSKPDEDTLTLGSLALHTGDRAYAVEFRDHLLQEAAQNLYTSPANSIKWGQYEAALRAHQLQFVSAAFPTLFTEEDWRILTDWFAAVNRRAMTVEWVDWLYAAAYGKRPEGPYENQEIGAGLLAALETDGLSADELATRNREYLDSTPLGWDAIFRNTDDSYSYQGTWWANALLINRYRQMFGEDSDTAQRNIDLSLLWAVLQSLPDGESLAYNNEGEFSMAAAYLFGATLSPSPELSWIAGKALQKLVEAGKFVSGQLPIERLDLADGQQPDIGSCLIFAHTGVPTTRGVLGPDKVVLRGGWADDSIYALLNLRFTGWHRYKATNTMPLIYQDGPLLAERWSAERLWWLPAGRAAFRDKRVPREYLNGLLLPRVGLPEVLWRLTEMGGPWLQDPPHFAGVDSFSTGHGLDMSKTTIDNWHGWRHERAVYLLHDGLVLVVDHATSDRASRPASIIWHVHGWGEPEESGLDLGNERRPARMVWPVEDESFVTVQELPPSNAYLRSPNWTVLYTSPLNSQLRSAVAFLTKAYTQGEFEVTYVGDRRGVLADWSSVGTTGALLHNFEEGAYLETDALGTDGTMLSLVRDEEGTQLCFEGGQTLRVRLAAGEQMQSIVNGTTTLDPSSWQLEGDWLVITPSSDLKNGCLQLEG